MSDSILPLQAENLCYQANGRPLIDDGDVIASIGEVGGGAASNGSGSEYGDLLKHGSISQEFF